MILKGRFLTALQEERRGHLDIIPLGLLFLGVIFLLIGWRWKSPHIEENAATLKGLVYLRNEILKVQDQVHVLEDEILKTKQMYQSQENQTVVEQIPSGITPMDAKEAVSEELKYQENERKKLELLELRLKELEHQEIELRQHELVSSELKIMQAKEVEHREKANLYSIELPEKREQISSASKGLFDEKKDTQRQVEGLTPQASYHFSEKFREVLELAAHGQRIPDIAQRLFMSQDAVRMVLSMQSKGGTR